MSDLKDFVIKDGVLTKYVGPGGDVVIPEEVTKIGKEAFLGSKITSIKLHEKISDIGDDAFLACFKLQDKDGFIIVGNILFECLSKKVNIVIPDGVVKISSHAFVKHYTLKSVVIPEGVTSIGREAFKNSPDLKTVYIPKTLKNIDDGAFWGCEKLQDENGFVIMNGLLLHCYSNSETIEIPNGVTRIQNRAFFGCKNLTKVTLPNSITSIGKKAFADCKKLEEITFSGTLAHIGESAFENCKKLNNISKLPKNCQIDESAFAGCAKLKNKDGFVIFNNILFACFSKSKRIAIPYGVTAINDRAFKNCTETKSIVIPNSVLSISKKAFENCEKIEEINLENFTNEKQINVLFKTLFEEKSTKLPILSYLLMEKLEFAKKQNLILAKIKANKAALTQSAIKTDNAKLLSNLFGLYKNISLDEMDKIISSCKNSSKVKLFALEFTNINYPEKKREKIEKLKIDKELGIKEKTIAEWNKIFKLQKTEEGYIICDYKGTDKHVVIPQKIKGCPVIKIGDHAFSRNEAILSAIIPEGVTHIETFAFYLCPKLKKITLPNSVSKIGPLAFKNCHKLTIYTANGYVKRFAKKNNIPFVAE